MSTEREIIFTLKVVPAPDGVTLSFEAAKGGMRPVAVARAQLPREALDDMHGNVVMDAVSLCNIANEAGHKNLHSAAKSLWALAHENLSRKNPLLKTLADLLERTRAQVRADAVRKHIPEYRDVPLQASDDALILPIDRGFFFDKTTRRNIIDPATDSRIGDAILAQVALNERLVFLPNTGSYALPLVAHIVLPGELSGLSGNANSMLREQDNTSVEFYAISPERDTLEWIAHRTVSDLCEDDSQSLILGSPHFSEIDQAAATEVVRYARSVANAHGIRLSAEPIQPGHGRTEPGL